MYQTFRLANEPDELGLSCTTAGLLLGGIPLLRKTEAGFVPRPPFQVATLIKAAYGADDCMSRLQSSLGVIAQALNRGDLARATMAAVLSRTPELSADATIRLAKAEEMLAKYDPDEPRDWHGRWTIGDDVVSPSTTTREADGATDRDDGPTGAEFLSLDRGSTEGTAQLIPAALELSGGDALGDTVRRHLEQMGVDVSNLGQDTAQTNGLPTPTSFTTVGDDASSDNPQSSKSLEQTFEQEYDDLGPVDFAKRVIQFGDWLERQAQSLSPTQRARSLAEYSFLQSRLSFWLAYDYKPAVAQLNLLSAAFTLYQGAINGGIVQVGHFPESMVDVFGAAWGLDGGSPRIRSTGEPSLPRIAPAGSPSEVEGLGGIVPIGQVGIRWGQGIKSQDGNFEDYVAEQNPGTQKLVVNAKTFDHFGEATGEAISDKTLYALTFNYINRPQSIYSKLKGYIDDAADYEPGTESDLNPAKIQSKTIQLAVPEFTSPAQWRYLYMAMRYGRERGVRVVVTRIRE